LAGEIGPEFPQGVWQSQFTRLRIPKLYNLRSDPFEQGPNSIYYANWMTHGVFVIVYTQAVVAQWPSSCASRATGRPLIQTAFCKSPD